MTSETTLQPAKMQQQMIIHAKFLNGKFEVFIWQPSTS
jgi:hypothetical protein